MTACSLSVMTLDPGLEQLIHNILQQTAPGQNIAMEPGLAERLFGALRDGARAVEEMGHPCRVGGVSPHPPLAV
jgi:flagellar biosynthesis protein FlhA